MHTSNLRVQLILKSRSGTAVADCLAIDVANRGRLDPVHHLLLKPAIPITKGSRHPLRSTYRKLFNRLTEVLEIGLTTLIQDMTDMSFMTQQG
jgi:hypothetical protein